MSVTDYSCQRQKEKHLVGKVCYFVIGLVIDSLSYDSEIYKTGIPLYGVLQSTTRSVFDVV